MGPAHSDPFYQEQLLFIFVHIFFKNIKFNLYRKGTNAARKRRHFSSLIQSEIPHLEWSVGDLVMA